MTNVLHVVGARPNFVKTAALMQALGDHPQRFSQMLVHTGQHYDRQLSDVFFAELGLPNPDVNLGVGSGSHAFQTAQVMVRFEPILRDIAPDWVVVVGDVNSTLACALVCAKLGIRVVHVEAGLRSFDRSMPEEVNRVLTDQLADLLMATEESAVDNLRREGVPEDRIHLVGNVMIDTLLRLLPHTELRPLLDELGVACGERFVLVTLHRPSNVDEPSALRAIARALATLAAEVQVLFPIHPRTRKALRCYDLEQALAGCRLLNPLGYLDFLALERRAALVITDSGGVQDETSYLGVPCITLRPNTERPVTISHGTNRLAPQREALLDVARGALAQSRPALVTPPPLWDGHAAERVANVLLARDPEIGGR